MLISGSLSYKLECKESLVEGAISLNINSLNKRKCLPGSSEYSVVFINRPFEEIAPVNLSPLTVQQVRLLLVNQNNRPLTLMFHLKLYEGKDLVISYQNLGHDFKSSRFKAATGGYRIKPFCFSYNKALLDYTTHSEISFQSIGLGLTAVQKNSLIRKIIQDYWFFDKTFNTYYCNGVTAIAQAIHSVLETILPFSFSQFHSSSFLNHLKRNGLLLESDIFENENLEKSERELDKLKVQMVQSEIELERKLLAKCSHLDLPFHLGFSKSELIETIRDKYELCRQRSLGANIHSNFQGGLDLSCHVKSKIWLASVIGSDESLMQLQRKIEMAKGQLSLFPNQI